MPDEVIDKAPPANATDKAIPVVHDGTPVRFAVLDVGTNSVKFHIGALEADGSWTAIADRAVVTRLGTNLDGGHISDAALERTVEAIAGMVAEAKENGVRDMAAVGTAVFRIAANAGEALAAIRERTGVRIEVLSGEEEARLAYLATIVALGSTVGRTVVFDTGGGSSQFTFGHGGAIDERFSVNVGAARYTDRFGLAGSVSGDVLRQAMAAIADDLSCLDGRPAPDILVGMGGALTNMIAVALGLAEYDRARVQGATVTSDEIDEQIEAYRSKDADARRRIIGLQPMRAEVILAGACIVRTIMRKLGKDALIVSDKGVRHGVLAERFGN